MSVPCKLAHKQNAVRGAVAVQYYPVVRLALLILIPLLHVKHVALGADERSTAPVEFATEYARELVSLEKTRARGEADLQDTTDPNGKLASGIHFSTLMQLELKSQIRMLQGMRLTGMFADLIPGMIVFDEHKIDLHQQLISLITEVLSGG